MTSVLEGDSLLKEIEKSLEDNPDEDNLMDETDLEGDKSIFSKKVPTSSKNLVKKSGL